MFEGSGPIDGPYLWRIHMLLWEGCTGIRGIRNVLPQEVRIYTHQNKHLYRAKSNSLISKRLSLFTDPP